MDTLASLLGRQGFLPHGYCFTWSPGLLWGMVASDALIALSYFAITGAILLYVRRRGGVSYPRVATLFCAFIAACGLTHVLDIWTIWQPDYGLQALVKGITAGVSALTAATMWPLLPHAVRLPTTAALQQANAALEQEVARRHSAEELLAEVQQQLSAALASVGAGFIAADAQGRVTRLNSVAERITGWAAAEALGQSLWQVFRREGRPAADAGMNPLDVYLRAGFSIADAHQLTIIARDGTRTLQEVKADLTRDAQGTPHGLVLILRDLTRQEQAAREHQRLAAIVASSSDAIISKALDGRITTWNQAAERLFGYTAEEAIGQPVLMLLPPDRMSEEAAIIAQLAQGRVVPPFDTQRRRRDGRLLDLQVTISPLRDGAGRIIGASKIARDLSAQRAAERALRERDAQLRLAMDAAHIGDWSLDLSDLRFTRSARFDACLGLQGLQADWRLADFLGRVHPLDRAAAQLHLDTAAASGGSFTLECRVVWADRSVHWLRLRGSRADQLGVAADDHSSAPRLFGVVTDIQVERAALDVQLRAERLEAENRQIQEANRIKSLFLANMSHELRTPLNAIIGFADLLAAGAVPAGSPRHDEFVGHIAGSGRHLLQLINDVLDLSKVESGKFEFTPGPVQLEDLVRSVTEVMQTGLQRKRLSLQVAVDPGLGTLHVDGARLKQVLFNYLSNAIKFTPEGGHIQVRGGPEGPHRFRLEVQDSGIGIAEADLPRLFVEFQQLDAGYDKQHAGTGLGLALTRRLVEAQGGQVGVRSQPGQGSVFDLVLDRDTRPLQGQAAPPPQASAPGAPQRLLVLEHDRLHQHRLTQGLAQAGFIVDGVGSGAEALARNRQQPYDGLTLSLGSPPADGLAAASQLHDIPGRPAPAVVGLTMPGPGGGIANFGVTDLLRKPLRSGEVAASLARIPLPRDRRACVMVVDDDALALQLMSETLLQVGMDAVSFQDGRTALAELDRYRPDVLVLDLMMPGFDGFAVLDALARRPRWRHLPVLIWTSTTLSDDEYEQLARSAAAIIHKGGGVLEGLLDRLRQWQRDAQLRAEDEARP